MSSSFFGERNISTMHDFRDIIPLLDDKWIFRGQCDYNWGLIPSIARIPTEFPVDVAEKIANWMFRRRAHHYLEANQIPQTELEWLALMQHHGAPTRLLDWTRSLYVAAFFASESPSPSPFSAIWALNVGWCYVHAIRIIRDKFSHLSHLTVHDDLTTDDIFNEAIISNVAQFIVPLEPARMNPRLGIQRGLFVVPGDVNASIEDNLLAMANHDTSTHVMKIKILKSLRRELLEELIRMNITSATLFPGLDGFSARIGQVLSASNSNDHIVHNIRSGKYASFMKYG
jgi:hypothetical protein